MKKRIPFVPVILVMALAGLMLSGIACHLLLPFSPAPTQNVQTYKCTAQIYRTIPGTSQEFTENWNAWLWSGDDSSATLVCDDKLNNYITQLMPHGLPEFDWQIRDLNVSTDPTPAAVDCDDPAPRAVYGAPVGNVLALSPANVSVSLFVSVTDNDGNVQTASPTLMAANFLYAERTGMGVSGGGYSPTIRHLRIPYMRIEFNPFDVGGVHVSRFYVQSIGTVIAMGGPTDYTILTGAAKFYMMATGEKGGNTAVTSQCFINPISASLKEVDYGTPFLAFSFDVFNITPPGYSFQINEMKINLATPNPTTFLQNQPQVYLKDKQWNTTSGYLTFVTGDIIGTSDPVDHIDTSKILWFENFETSNEAYLGNALILPVNLNWGQHAITVVVYDTKGSYATSTMNLTVKRLPGDVNGDGQVCSKDIQLIMAALGQKATGPDDPRDIDKDGSITIADSRKAALLCTYPNCVCK